HGLGPLQGDPCEKGEGGGCRSLGARDGVTRTDVDMATGTTSAGHQVTGRCLCGAVSFKGRVEKREIGACHCAMCRRWTSGPLLTLTGVAELTFEGEDN